MAADSNDEIRAPGAQAGAFTGFSLADASLQDVPQPPRDAAAVSTLIKDDSEYPATKQERLQEFVDGFGRIGKLYDDAVGDDARLGKFQERMAGVYALDHATFKELARLGERMTANPPASGEEVGKTLAQILNNTFERQGGTIDLSSPEMVNLQGALAGMMLAQRANFDQAGMSESTIAMVDAMENELTRLKVPAVHAIIWGDTKEPGLAVVPPGKSIDRHNFTG